MRIESSAFSARSSIPIQYTCEGANISPPLQVRYIPTGAKYLALVMEDPDAPGGIFTHWIAWNLDITNRILKEDVELPLEGKNDFGTIGYQGPRPPKGQTHHYYFRVYALNSPLDLPAGATRAQFEKALRGHVIIHTFLVGIYTAST